MTQTKQLSPNRLLHIAQALYIRLRSLVATISLLDDGGTVPFIARYRKEATGALDDVKIREIEEKVAYFRDLVSRRETILNSIAEQGKLTDELRQRIEETMDRGELEDLSADTATKRISLSMKALIGVTGPRARRVAKRSQHRGFRRSGSLRRRRWRTSWPRFDALENTIKRSALCSLPNIALSQIYDVSMSEWKFCTLM
jgi:hypothetical protein